MANKRKKASVPKRLAGVRIPKPVRRALKDLAASKSGRAAISEALVAAGAMLAVPQVKPKGKDRRPKGELAPDAVPVRPPAGNGAEARMAFEEATRSFTDTLRKRSLGETPGIMEPQPGAPTH